jgi:hypothetical protein
MSGIVYKSRPVTLEAAAQWEGERHRWPEELAEAAGAENVQQFQGGVQVRVSDGRWVTMLPGWWAARSDDGVTVLSDRAFQAHFEAVR